MNHYKHEKVGPHSYLVSEVFPGAKGGLAMGLFVGETRACIIDSGWGVTGNLRQYVEKITDLPVICLLTHPHPDHAGAAVWFDEVYMNPLDNSVVKWALQKEKRLRDAGHRRETDLDFIAEMEREISDCSKFSYHPMQDGDLFDLGGVTLEAIHIPGHTWGSMALYCREDNILCAGDSVGPTVSLVGEGDESPVPLAEYQKALSRLYGKTTPDTKLIIGHSVELQSVQLVEKLLAICDGAWADKEARHQSVGRLPKFLENAKVPYTLRCEDGVTLIWSGGNI